MPKMAEISGKKTHVQLKMAAIAPLYVGGNPELNLYVPVPPLRREESRIFPLIIGCKKSGHPPGSDGPMANIFKRYNGGRVLVFVVGVFAEMSGDVSRIYGTTAHDLARTHVSYYNDDAKRTKGMYRQRIQKAWGHTAHRGWARLLLNRARDLIIHGPAHRGANGAAKPTDEDNQDGHFFFNHPERGGYSAA